MSELQQTASLHEKAVQAVASGEVAPMPKRRRRTAQKPLVQPTFEAPLVNPEVWEVAREILHSGHGYTRWEVISEKEVIVR
jgi:hypothetical protein